ncbi:MAG: hypothetical protein K9M82_07600 [Deltaproteobacteria bacterium]|nr:hypothetical protein [Deltaproteobacteria bacterium]
MTERLKASIPLENGLTLDLLDESRPMAGGRWLVLLVARIEIPLDPGLLDAVPEGGRLLSILRREHGDRLEYRAELKKHFVGEADKDQVLESFTNIVLREKRPYLAHPDFARRFTLSRAAELKRKDPRLFA